MLCETKKWKAMECTSRYAVEVIYKKHFELVNVSEKMNEPDAFVVLNAISNYYFCLLLPFWHYFFNIIKVSINFCIAANDVSGIMDVLHQEHNCNASSVIEEMIDGKALAEQMKLDEPRMGQKKKRCLEKWLETPVLMQRGIWKERWKRV